MNEAVDRCAQAVHIKGFHVEVCIWFEYVHTDSNWADGASREAGNDSFIERHGFELQQVHLQRAVFDMPLVQLWDYLAN